MLSAGRRGDSRCWHGLTGAFLLLDVPSGVSLSLSFSACLSLEIVARGPGIHSASCCKHMVHFYMHLVP